MIPIRDTYSISRPPLICYALIGFMSIVFITEVSLEFSGELQDWIAYWGMIPGEITGLFQEAIATGNPAVWTFFFWRVFAILPALFLHGSYGQILGNLIFLFVFGRRVEEKIGRFSFLLFYLGSGLIASLIRIILDPELALPIIGANGAIAAILGAYTILAPQAKIESILPLIVVFIPINLPAVFYLFWWFIQQLSYGIGSFDLPINPFTPGYLLGQLLAMIWGAIAAYLWFKQQKSLDSIVAKRDKLNY